MTGTQLAPGSPAVTIAGVLVAVLAFYVVASVLLRHLSKTRIIGWTAMFGEDLIDTIDVDTEDDLFRIALTESGAETLSEILVTSPSEEVSASKFVSGDTLVIHVPFDGGIPSDTSPGVWTLAGYTEDGDPKLHARFAVTRGVMDG